MLALFAAALALAFRRGGPPERRTTIVITVWYAATLVYHAIAGPAGFDRIDPGDLLLDCAELVAITWVALRANRLWPLWAAAAQLICVSGHVSLLIQPHGMRRAYWAMTQIPPFIQLIALLLGALAHSKRFRRWGEYRSWRLA